MRSYLVSAADKLHNIGRRDRDSVHADDEPISFI